MTRKNGDGPGCAGTRGEWMAEVLLDVQGDVAATVDHGDAERRGGLHADGDAGATLRAAQPLEADDAPVAGHADRRGRRVDVVRPGAQRGCHVRAGCADASRSQLVAGGGNTVLGVVGCIEPQPDDLDAGAHVDGTPGRIGGDAGDVPGVVTHRTVGLAGYAPHDQLVVAVVRGGIEVGYWTLCQAAGVLESRPRRVRVAAGGSGRRLNARHAEGALLRFADRCTGCECQSECRHDGQKSSFHAHGTSLSVETMPSSYTMINPVKLATSKKLSLNFIRVAFIQEINLFSLKNLSNLTC